MSSSINDTEKAAPTQGVHWNEEDWQGLLRRLPRRVERAQEWISWLLGALIGSQQSPGWLPKTAGRVWLIDASRLKTPAGSGEDVKLHSAYNLCSGRLEYVEVSDRHSGDFQG